MRRTWIYISFFWGMLTFLLAGCIRPVERGGVVLSKSMEDEQTVPEIPVELNDTVGEDITVEKYFAWSRSLVEKYDSLLPYELTGHIIVHTNPWIIDTFMRTDYYVMMERDSFVMDQKQMLIIPAGTIIRIPSESETQSLQRKLAAMKIDINLPEFKLRIWQDDTILFAVPVRIGQKGEKYLPTEGRTVNLMTVIGDGTIVGINYSPKYINFNTGKAYTHTTRDDGRRTLMPLIPTLEPEINGICHGQLIHPTTNPATLGKAYSHGCIGTRETDAWRIFFHTRIGTPVRIRYDLEVVNEDGDTLHLEDIYGLEL